jgi:hypothetical protein
MLTVLPRAQGQELGWRWQFRKPAIKAWPFGKSWPWRPTAPRVNAGRAPPSPCGRVRASSRAAGGRGLLKGRSPRRGPFHSGQGRITWSATLLMGVVPHQTRPRFGGAFLSRSQENAPPAERGSFILINGGSFLPTLQPAITGLVPTDFAFCRHCPIFWRCHPRTSERSSPAPYRPKTAARCAPCSTCASTCLRCRNTARRTRAGSMRSGCCWNRPT